MTEGLPPLKLKDVLEHFVCRRYCPFSSYGLKDLNNPNGAIGPRCHQYKKVLEEADPYLEGMVPLEEKNNAERRVCGACKCFDHIHAMKDHAQKKSGTPDEDDPSYNDVEAAAMALHRVLFEHLQEAVPKVAEESQLKRQLAGQAQENKKKLQKQAEENAKQQQKQAEDHHSSMAVLQNRLQAMQNEHATRLNAVHAEFSDELTHQAEKELQAEQQMKMLQTEKGHLQQLLSVTQKGLDERETRSKAKLEEKLNEVQKTNNEVAQQELKQEYESMRQKHEAAQQEAKARLEEMQGNLEAKEKEVGELTDSVEELEDANGPLQKTVDVQQTKIDALVLAGACLSGGLNDVTSMNAGQLSRSKEFYSNGCLILKEIQKLPLISSRGVVWAELDKLLKAAPEPALHKAAMAASIRGAAGMQPREVRELIRQSKFG